MGLPVSSQENSKKVIGNDAVVTFANLGNKSLEGKVDTGATTSSLHAEQIKTSGNSVSFVCPDISNSVITMDLDGAQEVVSADAGGTTRPMVKFDIEIDGTPLRGVSFNLNDRSEMDSPILIGQNILTAGNFVVDVNKDSPETGETPSVTSDRDSEVLEAVRVLVNHDVTFGEFMEYMKTETLNKITE